MSPGLANPRRPRPKTISQGEGAGTITMNPLSRRSALLIVSTLGTLAAGCAIGVDAPAEQTAFMGIADAQAPYDQRFIDEMVMHHQGAIVSAQMMIADSKRPELRDLARRMVEGQQRQVDQMRSWRVEWYDSAGGGGAEMGGMAEMMGQMGAGGMMMPRGMGDDTSDRMFLRMMIPHHQLAIDMAEEALTRAEHGPLEVLAREIIADQDAEIAEMERYLRDWYGESSTRDMADDMRDMMQQMMGP